MLPVICSTVVGLVLAMMCALSDRVPSLAPCDSDVERTSKQWRGWPNRLGTIDVGSVVRTSLCRRNLRLQRALVRRDDVRVTRNAWPGVR